jgi:hypothetical protein
LLDKMWPVRLLSWRRHSLDHGRATHLMQVAQLLTHQ